MDSPKDAEGDKAGKLWVVDFLSGLFVARETGKPNNLRVEATTKRGSEKRGHHCFVVRARHFVGVS